MVRRPQTPWPLSLALAVLTGCAAPAPTTPTPVTEAGGPAPAPAAAAPGPTATIAPELPPVAAPSTLRGIASFRGAALAQAPVKLVDAATGAAIAGEPAVTDASGRFSLAVPAGVSWVRVMVSAGPSTLTSLVRVGEGRVVLDAGEAAVDEVSTVLTQAGLGLWLMLAALPADQAEAARRHHLEALGAQRGALAEAFARAPQLANRVVADSDPDSGLPREGDAAEQAVQDAGGLDALKAATREALSAIVAAYQAGGGEPALPEGNVVYLGPDLAATRRDGAIVLTVPRGPAIRLTAGASELAGLLERMKSPTFFDKARTRHHAEPPSVTGISPAYGQAGDTFTIAGAGFDAVTPANNVVTVGGEPATVTAATATQLTVLVPATQTGASIVSVTVAGRPAAEAPAYTVVAPVTTGATSYSSQYYNGGYYGRTPAYTDVFTGGGWTGPTGGQAWVNRTFGGTYMVKEIRMDEASSDWHFGHCTSIDVKLQAPDGNWVVADHLVDANIVPDGHGTQTSYLLVLDTPVAAKAFRLELNGNGWFVARNIRVQGYAPLP